MHFNVIKRKTVLFSSANTTYKIRLPLLFVFLFKIQCTVSASKDPASTNCKSTDSPSFFAGIKVQSFLRKISFEFNMFKV